MLDYTLILSVLAGIGVLLFLILRLKIQAFLALLIASITVGLLAGMPGADILDSITRGMGDTLGFVATIVGLGALFGAILEHSGGAQAIAQFLLRKVGVERAPLAMSVTGFIVAIPVFFDVAFVILVPLVYALRKRSGRSLLLFAIPLLAGLAVTHAFIPPTPGPVAVADIIGANLGWVIAMGFVAGIPAVLVAGLWFGKYISKRIDLAIPEYIDVQDEVPENAPAAREIVAIIVMPIVIILMNTVLTGPLGSSLGLTAGIIGTMAFLGHPFTALILANLLAWYFLGIRRGISRQTLADISMKSLGPAGLIILLTGAGGVFKQVLIDTGVGTMLAESMAGATSLPIIFAWIVALLVRVMQGSATVAMITAAGIVAPMLANADMSAPELALLVIAIAAGATGLSHVNDSGFWLVNRYLGMSEQQTFRSFTVMTALISITGFAVALLLTLVL